MFDDAKQELSKLAWAVNNEENKYLTRVPALVQNITVIDNDAKPQSDPIDDTKKWIVQISYPLTRSHLVIDNQQQRKRGYYQARHGESRGTRGGYRGGPSGRGKHIVLPLTHQTYPRNRDFNRTSAQHINIYNKVLHKAYVLPVCYLPSHSRLTQIYLKQEGNPPTNHGNAIWSIPRSPVFGVSIFVP